MISCNIVVSVYTNKYSYGKKSISEKLNYTYLAREKFSETIKASLVNRFLYERLDNNKYEFIINKLSNQTDLISFLRKRYNYNFKRKILYPIAKIFVGER